MAVPYLRFMGLLAAGFGISPQEFWRMTPRELKALVDAMRDRFAPEERMRRSELEKLMRLHPDGSGKDV